MREVTGKERLIELVRARALQYGTREEEFTLKSGAKSHFYLDVRKLTLSDAVHVVCSELDALLSKLRLANPVAIGGPESGANQIIGAYMCWLGFARAGCVDNLGLPMGPIYLNGFTVRKQEKDHGLKELIVGNLKTGDRAIVVEDVTTTGGSAMVAVNAVRAAGADVLQVISVVDRLQGAAKLFETLKIPFVALLTIDDLKIDPRRPGFNCPD